MLLRGTSLFAVLTLGWVTILVISCGGIVNMVHSFSDYFEFQAQQTSFLFDASSWRRMAGRAIIWTTLGSLPWLWTLPFGWRQRNQLPHCSTRLRFLAIWFLPPFLFNLFIHIGSPGHALASIPALCVVGGFCLTAAEHSLARWIPELEERGLLIWIALLGSTFLFFGRFPFPQGPHRSPFRGLASVKDALLARTYESSHSRIRWVDETTELALKEIGTLRAAAERPVLLIWARDGEPAWRKLGFYFPFQKLYVLEEQANPQMGPPTARLWLGKRLLEEHTGRLPLRLPVPEAGRLIWIISPSEKESLRRAVPLQGAFPTYYTDLPPDTSSFRWGSFEFLPSESFSSLNPRSNRHPE